MALNPPTHERQVNVAATLAFLVALAALAAPAQSWLPGGRGPGPLAGGWRLLLRCGGCAQFAVMTAVGGSRPGSSPVTMNPVQTPIPTAWSATRS